ncbi:MAG TPA: hypothetical protein VM282_03790 [Acidimicrobiales bacterium]|nr:hypothetical protein [Acidimicrobiales bacterium]
MATPTTGPWTDDDAERWFHRLGTGDTIEWVIDADERLLGATRLTFDGPSSAKYAIGFFDRLDSAKGSELR